MFSELAVAAALFGRLDITVAPWSAACRVEQPDKPRDCDLPKPLSQPVSLQAVEFQELAAGQADFVQRDLVIRDPNGNPAHDVHAKFEFYAVLPKPESGLPPYIQLKVELLSPVRATCAVSPKWTPNQPIVPLICIGSGVDQEIGLTITGLAQ